jgi:hypothetical protein
MHAEQLQEEADERQSIERAFLEADAVMDKVDTPNTNRSKQLIDYQQHQQAIFLEQQRLQFELEKKKLAEEKE